MPHNLGWIRTDETPEGFVSVLVVRHPDGVSAEGAVHQRNEAEKAIAATGLDLFGVTTGVGEAGPEALKALKAVWGGET